MFSPLMRSKPSPLRRAWFSLALGGALFAASVGGHLWPCTARAADPTPAPRDWSKNPAILELDIPKDVVLYAVGDPHADYGRLVQLLVKGDIIDDVSLQPDQLASVKWKAGNAVLVCTGDMIDKWNNSVEVLQLFMHLQKIAAAAGGRVIVTSGNHEAEFLNKPDSDKKAKVFLAQLRGLGVDPQQVANGTDSLGLGQFVRSLPFAARVNDWFFAHAGNTNSMNPVKATKPRSLADLSSFLQSDVTKNGYGAAALSASDSILEAKLDSPWWEEPGDSPSGPESADRLRKYVTALGTSSHPINHLVIGHQPGKVKFNGDLLRPKGVMANRYLGLIFLIDCGMSSGVNYSTGALLRIRSDDVYGIRFDAPKEELLLERMVK